MMGWLKKKLSQAYGYHTADFSGIKPRFQIKAPYVYMDSPAGLLVYKAKTDKDIARYRNTYLNRFNALKKPNEFITFYKEIKTKEKVKHKANLRTRLCSLNPSL